MADGARLTNGVIMAIDLVWILDCVSAAESLHDAAPCSQSSCSVHAADRLLGPEDASAPSSSSCRIDSHPMPECAVWHELKDSLIFATLDGLSEGGIIG